LFSHPEITITLRKSTLLISEKCEEQFNPKKMKQIFTLCALALSATFSNAQVVLNEVYTDPGNGKHEFFEFYNTSSVSQNMDNFAIVTYYTEPGNKSGFYIMDLPNQNVFAKAYFVGAAANPFSVQGQNNLTADFNWNAMPAGGAVTKWEKNGTGYTQVAVPANLNDFIVSVSGSGCNHHMLVFNNGVLINGLFTGTNFATLPAYFKAMPNLPVNMLGASQDFTIVFSTLADNRAEYVNSASGNDNGYMRQSDGKCGVWIKSTSQINHTPGMPNGPATGVTGDITITATLTDYALDPNKSVLTYNVTAGTLAAFPLVMEAYRDLGVIGGLGIGDVLVDSRPINNTSAGDQTVIMPTRNDPAMLVAITPSGCFDRVIAVTNATTRTLPVKLNNFMGSKNKSNVQLQWNVSTNEISNTFEVERSTNGKNFETAAVMFGTEKAGNETYSFTEMNEDAKVYYRLRMTDKSNAVSYSKILVFNSSASNSKPLNVIGNVINDKLTFSYESAVTIKAEIRILDMNGKIVAKQTLNTNKGNNLASISMPSSLNNGMYLAVLTIENSNSTAKFIKQ
jgi:hypothetical protein